MCLRFLLHFFALISIIKLGSGKITCTYELNFFDYACRLTNQVISSKNDMLEIDGTHLAGYGDRNVTALRTTNSTVQVFPSLFALKFENLEKLILSDTNFETFSGSLENCEKLWMISFIQNPIKIIPSGVFKNCKNLLNLFFVDTEIIQIDEKVFEDLKNIKVLSISGGRFSEFSQDFFKNLGHLESLTLSGNLIENFPGQIFWSLTKLEELNLDNNNISVINSELFQKNVNLVSLNLNGNKLNFLDEEQAAGVFENLKSLEKLSLGYNQIHQLPAFKGLENLDTLDVSYNKLTKPHPSSYEVLTNLKYLRMSGNQILLDKSFLKFSKNLRFLMLDNNQIANIEHSAFSELNNLGNLNLSHNNLAQLEGKSFKGLTSLYDLDLSFNKIEKIDRAIFGNFKLLLKLDMRENQCANDVILWINDEKIDNTLSQCFNSSNVLETSFNLMLIFSFISIDFF